MTFSLKKHIEDGIVTVAVSLPNLAITLTAVTVGAVVFHWTGFMSTLAYLIGIFISTNYSAFFGQSTDMTFTLPKWLGGKTYHYANRRSD